jgi:hypothetical protein
LAPRTPYRPQSRYGWRFQPRDGVKDLLRSLTSPDSPTFVAMWSEHNSGGAMEVIEKLSVEIGGPPVHTNPLGSEHMFIREGGKRKEKRIEHFNRSPKNILLIGA